MTIHDLLCDVCGRMLAGLEYDLPASPARGLRFLVHPGDAHKYDNSILICAEPCWARVGAPLGEPNRDGVCARCDRPVEYASSLHVTRMIPPDNPSWQLCRAHGTELLNEFTFIQPKLGEADLKLAADFPTD